MSNTDVIEVCAEERANKKWELHKFTNVTVFAALLRQAPMLCKDAVLQEPLTKNHTNICITFEKKHEKTEQCQSVLCKALVLHLHRNGGTEEKTSKTVNLVPEKKDRSNPGSF